MNKTKSPYHGHRFVINCAVRWYFRFSLSLRDIEELLLEQGVVVTYETIHCWCDKFGAGFARCAKPVRRKPGRTWHIDEMFVTHTAHARIQEFPLCPHPVEEHLTHAHDREGSNERQWHPILLC